MKEQLTLLTAEKRRKGSQDRKALNQLAASQANAFLVRPSENRGFSDLPLFKEETQTKLF